MTLGTVLVILLALGGLAWLVAPLLGRSSHLPGERRETALDEMRELHARQQMLLASLKDLEDDRETDKIGDEDYETLKARLSTQTVEVMQRLDLVEQAREQALAEERKASQPLAYPGKRRTDGVS